MSKKSKKVRGETLEDTGDVKLVDDAAIYVADGEGTFQSIMQSVLGPASAQFPVERQVELLGALLSSLARGDLPASICAAGGASAAPVTEILAAIASASASIAEKAGLTLNGRCRIADADPAVTAALLAAGQIGLAVAVGALQTLTVRPAIQPSPELLQAARECRDSLREQMKAGATLEQADIPGMPSELAAARPRSPARASQADVAMAARLGCSPDDLAAIRDLLDEDEEVQS